MPVGLFERAGDHGSRVAPPRAARAAGVYAANLPLGTTPLGDAG
jgi:hypothetical protein